MKSLPFLALTLLLATNPLKTCAEVKLPPVFSNHMVLQRQMPVPIWGTAAAGEKVTVKFRTQEKTAVADAQGAWKVLLDPIEAGGPETLTVAGANTLTFENVLVGEVWVGSGQSNMAGAPTGYLPSATRPINTKFSGDKNLEAIIKGAPYPQIRLLVGVGRASWQEATPENLGKFSALLQSFGIPLHKKLGVPVGLMVGAVGGTSSGCWLTPQALAEDAACQQAIEKAKATFNLEQAQAKGDKLLKQYETDLAAWNQLSEEQKKGKRAPNRPQMMVRPGESQHLIGSLYERHIRQFIGYAIRGVLWDQGESGTAINGVDQFTLMGALIRGWRKDWKQGDFPFLYVQKPSGGGCAYDPADPLFAWASEPFAPLPPAIPTDGAQRENHIKIASYPSTFMVTASDLGSGTHPANKAGYGARAAQVALGTVYGEKVATIGPVFAGHAVEGNKVRVRYTHVGQGLVFRGGDKLQGFALAGADKVFSWADATIEGDGVVLSSAKVPTPVHVRYAWSNRHNWANLFNKDGLPAIPFRTDE